ncbi:MAG: hypothetical protein M3126_10725, partial [Candidatus Eremiobacteraeota bacterium]|nr:hypothetical protein [Candidatus Eremiobacteraeota bacterium]
MYNEIEKEPPARGSFSTWCWIVVQIMVILVGLQVLVVHPSADWVETNFINGTYPLLENGLAGFTSQLSFPAGDAFVILGGLLVLVRIVVWIGRPGKIRARFVRCAIEIAAIGSIYAISF